MMDEELRFQQLLEHETKTIKSIDNSTTPIIYPIDMFNGFLIDKVPKSILDNIDTHVKKMDLMNTHIVTGKQIGRAHV